MKTRSIEVTVIARDTKGVPITYLCNSPKCQKTPHVAGAEKIRLTNKQVEKEQPYCAACKSPLSYC